MVAKTIPHSPRSEGMLLMFSGTKSVSYLHKAAGPSAISISFFIKLRLDIQSEWSDNARIAGNRLRPRDTLCKRRPNVIHAVSLELNLRSNPFCPKGCLQSSWNNDGDRIRGE